MVEQAAAPSDASASDANDYNNMRVPQIRRLCDLRGLPSQGLKSSLVAQLVEYDLRQQKGIVASSAEAGVVAGDISVSAEPPVASVSQGVTKPKPSTTPVQPSAATSVATPVAAPLSVPSTVQPALQAAPGAGARPAAPCVPSTTLQPQVPVTAFEPVPKSASSMEVPANRTKSPQRPVAPRRSGGVPTAVKSVATRKVSNGSMACAREPHGKPPTTDLTEEERNLRALLQFCICADVRRPSASQAPLGLRYRELIITAYDAVSTGNNCSQASLPAFVAGLQSSSSPASSSSCAAHAAKGVAVSLEVGQGDVKSRLPMRGSVRLSHNPALPREPDKDEISTGNDAPDERPPKQQRLLEEHVAARLECARLHARHAALQAKQDHIREQLAKVATARHQAANVARQRREEEAEAWAKLRQSFLTWQSVAASSCNELRNSLYSLQAAAATLVRSQASNGVTTPYG